MRSDPKTAEHCAILQRGFRIRRKSLVTNSLPQESLTEWGPSGPVRPAKERGQSICIDYPRAQIAGFGGCPFEMIGYRERLRSARRVCKKPMPSNAKPARTMLDGSGAAMVVPLKVTMSKRKLPLVAS